MAAAPYVMDANGAATHGWPGWAALPSEFTAPGPLIPTIAGAEKENGRAAKNEQPRTVKREFAGSAQEIGVAMGEPRKKLNSPEAQPPNFGEAPILEDSPLS